MTKPTPKQINNLLPQTQCGLCDYDGCKPYAEAIVNNNEKIDHCLPGNIRTLIKLAKMTNQDPTPMLANMQKNYKPPSLVIIRENECIGCTKCIQACPVDAIIGSAKQMHTIITTECTGCDLCIEPCPVDCIDVIKLNEISERIQQTKSQLAQLRYEYRNVRLAKFSKNRKQKHQSAKLNTVNRKQTIEARKAAILAAVERVEKKRHTSILKE